MHTFINMRTCVHSSGKFTYITIADNYIQTVFSRALVFGAPDLEIHVRV